jgi:hypothetical protein
LPADPGPDGAASRSASAGPGLMPARVGPPSPRSGQGPRRPRFQPICGIGSPPRRAPRPRGRRRGASRTPRGPLPRLRSGPLPKKPSPPSRGREVLHRLPPWTGPHRLQRMSPPAPGAGCRRGHREARLSVPAPPKRLPSPRLPRGTSRLPRSGPRPMKTRSSFPGGRRVRWAAGADAHRRPKPRRSGRGSPPGRPGRPGAGCPDPLKPVVHPSAFAES